MPQDRLWFLVSEWGMVTKLMLLNLQGLPFEKASNAHHLTKDHKSRILVSLRVLVINTNVQIFKGALKEIIMIYKKCSHFHF